jgi:hypothetical protein
MSSETRYDKATLGPGCGRGTGGRAWMRWNRRNRTESIKIKRPERYLNSYARAWLRAK